MQLISKSQHQSSSVFLASSEKSEWDTLTSSIELKGELKKGTKGLSSLLQSSKDRILKTS